MWSWRSFNTIVSHLAHFYQETTLLFHSPTTSTLPRRANVLNTTRTLSATSARQCCSLSDPDGVGEKEPLPSKTTAALEHAHHSATTHNIKGYVPVALQSNHPGTTTAKPPDKKHSPLVSASTDALNVGRNATTRSSASREGLVGIVCHGLDTPATFRTNVKGHHRRITAASATEIAETYTMESSSTNVPEETGITTSSFSFASPQTYTSVSTSAIATSSFTDRPFSPSSTQPGSTSRSFPISSLSSFTTQISLSLPIISSTESSSTSTILSSRDASMSSSGSSPSAAHSTSRRSATPSLPAYTTITSTITSSSTLSGHSTAWPSVTDMTSPSGIGSSWSSGSSTKSIITTTRKCWANPIGTTCPPRITSATPTSHTTYSGTWTGQGPPTSSVTQWSRSSKTTTASTSSPTSVIPFTTLTASAGFPTMTGSTSMPLVSTSSSQTSSSTTTTGALRTDIPAFSSFARNTGAIVGVSIAATTVLLCLVLVLFFACRRYRRQGVPHGSTEDILTLAREVSWRRPLDGDESYMEKPQSHPASGSVDHSIDDTHEAFGSTTAGHGSSESGTLDMPLLTTVLIGQTPMSGPSRSVESAVTVPSSNPYRHVDTGGSRSVASLIATRESSSSREVSGPFASMTEEPGKKYKLRKSLSGPRPMVSDPSRRHSSTPPTAFTHTLPPGLSDYERQTPAVDQSDRLSVKSFISRLRNGRRMSVQSVATVRGPSFSSSRESDAPSVSVFSPSLLNPPVTVTPPLPVLTFPRGVTGNGYNPNGPETVGTSNDVSGHSSLLWPPVTLPPSPSPSSTDNSSMAEGLLHPRLSQLQPSQASMTSLRDHEDYSRPISGLVRNHLRSTTTFETQDTTES